MKCPVDNAVLLISERSGIEIDYCPQCRGVWLDRGELDKILDRSEASPSSAPQMPPAQPRYDDRDRNRGYGRDQGYGRKRKRESWLSDLFD